MFGGMIGSGAAAERGGGQQPGGGGAAGARGDNNATDPEYHHPRPGWMRSVMGGMETNAQFVFKGTMRGGCALLGIVSLFLASCQIISFMQEENQW